MHSPWPLSLGRPRRQPRPMTTATERDPVGRQGPTVGRACLQVSSMGGGAAAPRQDFRRLANQSRQKLTWHTACGILSPRLPMRLRYLLKGSWGRVAIATLALLILAAGLCCPDQDQGGMGDHGILMGLCLLVLLVPAVILPLAGLVPRGFEVSLARPVFAAVPLAVPKPPPRRIGLA